MDIDNTHWCILRSHYDPVVLQGNSQNGTTDNRVRVNISNNQGDHLTLRHNKFFRPMGIRFRGEIVKKLSVPHLQRQYKLPVSIATTCSFLAMLLKVRPNISASIVNIPSDPV